MLMGQYQTQHSRQKRLAFQGFSKLCTICPCTVQLIQYVLMSNSAIEQCNDLCILHCCTMYLSYTSNCSKTCCKYRKLDIVGSFVFLLLGVDIYVIPSKFLGSAHRKRHIPRKIRPDYRIIKYFMGTNRSFYKMYIYW